MKTTFGYLTFFLIAGILAFAILLGSQQNVLTAQRKNDAAMALQSQQANVSLLNYAQKLKRSDSPRNRVVAAYIISVISAGHSKGETAPPAETIALMKHALAAAPNDTDLAWLAASNCPFLGDACSPKLASERLIALEPDNVMAYLPALNFAVTANDKRTQIALIEKMGQATRSDSHLFSITHMFYQGLENWQAPINYSPEDIYGPGLKNTSAITQKEARLVSAFGYSIAMAMPGLQPLMQQCKPADISAAMRSHCQKIARVLLKDKSLLMSSVALNIGLHVFNAEPDASQWRALYRQRKWIETAAYSKTSLDFERESIAAWPNTDEIKTLERRAMINGGSLTPPKNWQPKDEGYQKILHQSKKP
jgi:hypothetical protein